MNKIKEQKIKKESDIKIGLKIEKKQKMKRIIKDPNDFEIQVTERFYTQPNYSFSVEKEEENSIIIHPKYLNNKLIKTPHKKENNEKIKYKKRKQNSDLLNNNFFESKQNISPTKIMFKTIDSFNKEKDDLDNNFHEDDKIKTKIINLKLKSKGDKSFGTTIIKDFNLILEDDNYG